MVEISKRQQIKKDELEEIIFKIAEWIKKNRPLFFSILGILTGLFLLTLFFITRYQLIRSRGADKLAIGQAQIYRGEYEQGLTMLDAVIKEYPGTYAAAHARLTKARYLIDKKNYEEAKNTLQPIIDSSKPKQLLPLALSMLGSIYEDEENYEKALKTYSLFLEKFPEHFFASRIYESIARIYELTGNINEAISTYEKIATLFPATEWSSMAQERISMLSVKK